jgi:hypothetical protein
VPHVRICGGGAQQWVSLLRPSAAANYRTLRATGRTVRKTIDCLIATFCLRHGHSLLHCDRDFDPFEEVLGLRVIHPDAAASELVVSEDDPDPTDE